MVCAEKVAKNRSAVLRAGPIPASQRLSTVAPASCVIIARQADPRALRSLPVPPARSTSAPDSIHICLRLLSTACQSALSTAEGELRCRIAHIRIAHIHPDVRAPVRITIPSLEALYLAELGAGERRQRKIHTYINWICRGTPQSSVSIR